MTVSATDLQRSARRKILDFGCGTGWVLAEAPAAARETLLVGLDFSPALLLEGRRRFKSLCFVRGNGVALPFGADSFDEVIGHVSLPYMNTSAALREIHRVLAPGGAFFLTFHSLAYVRERFLDSVRKGRWKDVLFMLYITANGLLNHCGLPQLPWLRGKFETFNTAAGVARTARKIGLSVVHIEQRPDLIFFGVTGRKPDPQCRETPPDPGWSLSTVIRLAATEPATVLRADPAD